MQKMLKFEKACFPDEDGFVILQTDNPDSYNWCIEVILSVFTHNEFTLHIYYTVLQIS